jgi:hypothetical protein
LVVDVEWTWTFVVDLDVVEVEVQVEVEDHVHVQVHVHVHVTRSTAIDPSRCPVTPSPVPDMAARNPADPGRSALAARLQ